MLSSLPGEEEEEAGSEAALLKAGSHPKIKGASGRTPPRPSLRAKRGPSVGRGTMGTIMQPQDGSARNRAMCPAQAVL